MEASRRKVLQVLLVASSLLGLVAVGTVGYMVLEDMSPVDALYMAVVVLSTVGLGAFRPLSDPGKVFTIFLIVGGVAVFSYYLTRLFGLVVEKGLVEALERRRMTKKIQDLKDHYVVCGHGRIGTVVLSEFCQRSVPLVVVERRPEEVERLSATGCLVLQGDAREEAVLRRAGVERARGLIALLPEDPDNLYVILTARDLNPRITIFARANDPMGERRLLQAGADHVISPHREGGKRIARMILHPHVTDFLEMATEGKNLRLQMEEVVVRPESPLAGKRLQEAEALRKNRLLVVAVQRGTEAMVFNPDGSTRIEAGDTLIVLGSAIPEDLF
jgi:voltage-gated potassium channel